MATWSTAELLDWLAQQLFLTPAQVDAMRPLVVSFPDSLALAKELIRRDWLTPYQVNQIFQGKGEQLIFDSYRLRERIGEGSMGQVFKAWAVRLERIVAVKMIHADKGISAKTLERFRREMRAAAQLDHPNIARIRDAGDVGGRIYMVMDYIDGFNLSARVKQHGPLPIDDAVEYTRQTALGLQHAHERGVVHRDIKPANLLVAIGGGGADGKPLLKILDFGLARQEAEGANPGRLTQLGNLLGTVDFMAPEQAQDAHRVDIRADIYSLGCSLFYFLTAKPPFAGASVIERLGPRLTGEPPWVRTLRPEVSPALEEVLRKMMARLPEDRYQTPAAAAAALAGLAAPAAPPEVPLAMPIAEETSTSAVVPLAAPVEAPADSPAPPDGELVDLSVAPSEPVQSRGAAAPKSLPWLLISLVGGGMLLLLGLCGVAAFLVNPFAGGPAKKQGSLEITEAKFSVPDGKVKPGDTKFVLIRIKRADFAGPVTVSLKSLPEGVVAKQVILQETKLQDQVSFTVSHGTDPISAEIRVVAENQAEGVRDEKSLKLMIVAAKK